MNRLLREYHVFLSCPREMRVLLITNMILTFVLPVVDIFMAAYVMRNSHEVRLVMTFQLAVYTGIPFAFLANGALLGRIGIQRLYSAGMLLLGASMVAMMSSGVITGIGIVISGLSIGLAFGLFAANRGLLALSTTTNDNRNYYYGVEMFFYTATSVLVPLAVGWFIEMTALHAWFGGDRNNAYKVVAGCVCGLTVLAALVCHQGRFITPPNTRFLFLRFHPLWYRMLWLAVLKGLAQGYIVTAPAMLIMLLVGQEGALGTAQAVGGILSAFLLYGVGRRALPRHRILVFAAGLLLFLLGGIVNAVLFNAPGVLILMVCLLLAKPLLDLAYFPIQFLVTDAVSATEGKNQFAYICNHEFGIYIGRLLGCGLFIVLVICVSDEVALKYALPVIGALQLLSIWVARRMLTEEAVLETTQSRGRNRVMSSVIPGVSTLFAGPTSDDRVTADFKQFESAMTQFWRAVY